MTRGSSILATELCTTCPFPSSLYIPLCPAILSDDGEFTFILGLRLSNCKPITPSLPSRKILNYSSASPVRVGEPSLNLWRTVYWSHSLITRLVITLLFNVDELLILLISLITTVEILLNCFEASMVKRGAGIVERE